jgi:DNA polymerase-1
MGTVKLSSGKQLGEWLRLKLSTTELEGWPRTASGRLATDASSLQLFAHLPEIQPLLRYKAITKLLGTYGAKPYLKYRNPVTDRLHPRFALGQTRSGRIVASKPNTQQCPRGAEFRALFTANPGHVLVSADYSQIELMVAALLSKDEAMLNVYRQGGDLHTRTASVIAGVPVEQVTKAQRQAAKSVNFGNLYGQRAKGLSQTAKLNYGVSMSVSEAGAALRKFAAAYPALHRWKQAQVAQAVQFGRVKTRMGLIRDFKAQGGNYIEGEAQNIPVQGSSAEILCRALLRLPAALKPTGAELYHAVHDEITLQTPIGTETETAAALQQAMIDGFLDVFSEAEPYLPAPEVKVGASWAQVH